jgi:four helix bundle protein
VCAITALRETLRCGLGFVAVARSGMGDFKKLQVWRKAHELSLNVYRNTRRIRGADISLRSQIVKAAMSVPTNIVEGNGYKSPRDFIRFLGYSINSATELEYHLTVARDLDLLSKSDFRALVDQLIEVRKMIHGLVNYLSRKKDEGEDKDSA